MCKGEKVGALHREEGVIESCKNLLRTVPNDEPGITGIISLMSRQTTAPLIGLMALTMLLAACNLPTKPESSADPTAEETPVVGTTGSAGEQTTGGETAEPPTPAPPTITPTIPPPPEGWLAYTDDGLGLSYYYPPGWSVTPVHDQKVDIRQDDGFAWLEINSIDEYNAKEWGLSYQPGMSAERILETLVNAINEDGQIGEPYHLLTGDGRTAWAAQGSYQVYGDRVFVAVIGYPARAIIVLGHESSDESEWSSLLVPLYQTWVENLRSVP